MGVQDRVLGYHVMAVQTLDREQDTITCSNSWGSCAPVVGIRMERPDLVIWRVKVLVIAE